MRRGFLRHMFLRLADGRTEHVQPADGMELIVFDDAFQADEAMRRLELWGKPLSGESPPDHVSFPTDDEPEGPECPRLHVLGALDYYLAVHPGEDWPSTSNTFRANTSGSRDHRITFLIAALFKLGRGDREGARAAARAFIEELGIETRLTSSSPPVPVFPRHRRRAEAWARERFGPRDDQHILPPREWDDLVNVRAAAIAERDAQLADWLDARGGLDPVLVDLAAELRSPDCSIDAEAEHG